MHPKLSQLNRLLLNARLAQAVVLVDNMTTQETAAAADDRDIQDTIDAVRNSLGQMPSRYADKQLQHLDHIVESVGVLSHRNPPHHDPCYAVRIKFTGRGAKEAARIVLSKLKAGEIDVMYDDLGAFNDDDSGRNKIEYDIHDCKSHALQNPASSDTMVEHIDEVMGHLSGTPTALEINRAVVTHAAKHGIDPRNQAEIRRQILQSVYGQVSRYSSPNTF